MKKIPASLQKMRYDKQGEIVQVVCLVDVRFRYQEVGDLTERFNSIDELIEFAKVVFKNRFIGKWELYVESPFDKYKGKISV